MPPYAAPPTLTEALSVAPREVAAFVGGGGKTTAMYRLCREAAALGRRAVASGTARFTLPAGRLEVPLLVHADEEALLASVRGRLGRDGPWLIAAAGLGSKERLLPITGDLVSRLAAAPEVDLLALEADGSALRPFKAPAGHEPVVPAAATIVVAVVGADVFGRPLTEAFVHRPERVAALTGAREGDRVTPAMVAAVLADERGGRKGVPEAARFAVLVNKVTASRLEAARETARLLLDRGVRRVVLGRVREPDPVVELLLND